MNEPIIQNELTIRKVRIYHPIKEGDHVNLVAMHPIRWADLTKRYGISVEEQREMRLTGIDTDPEDAEV